MHAVRPQLKETKPVYYLDDRICFDTCGELTEIEDPGQELRRLFALLDGTRTVEQVEEAFRLELPASAVDVREVVAQLDSGGFLMDAAAPADLDEHELERWSRNLGLFETYATLERSKYEMQERLRACRVALLGVGGVGTHLALDLLGTGIQDVLIADYDRVELSNLNRQVLYEESDLGSVKVEIAARRMRAFDSRARVEAVHRRIGSGDDVYELVHGRDLVLACMDRPMTRIVRWVNEGCVRAGVPFMSGGVDTKRVLLYTVAPGVSGCIACWERSAITDEVTLALRDQMEVRFKDATPIGPYRAAFGPLVTVLTGLMITEVVRLATGIAPPVALGRALEQHLDDGVLRESERWDRLPDCEVCASAKPHLERLALEGRGRQASPSPGVPAKPASRGGRPPPAAPRLRGETTNPHGPAKPGLRAMLGLEKEEGLP